MFRKNSYVFLNSIIGHIEDFCISENKKQPCPNSFAPFGTWLRSTGYGKKIKDQTNNSIQTCNDLTSTNTEVHENKRKRMEEDAEITNNTLSDQTTSTSRKASGEHTGLELELSGVRQPSDSLSLKKFIWINEPDIVFLFEVVGAKVE